MDIQYHNDLGYYVAISHDLSVLADDAFLIAIGSDFRRPYAIMPCHNKWVPSRVCRLGKVGQLRVVCKMPIFRQTCTSIVENVQVFIQTTIPVQGRTQQTHFNTVGNFYMMALCSQIGSFVRLSPCHFVFTFLSASIAVCSFLLSLKDLQYKLLTALAHT